MNDILNVSSKNSYLTTKQWEEVVEYVKNRTNYVNEPAVEETEEVTESEEVVENQHSEAYEQLIQTTSVSEMYEVLLVIMNEEPEKLYEITSDELQTLYNMATQMNEENPSDDYVDLIDTLQYLAGDYDLNGAEILAETWSATTYTANTTKTLSSNVTLNGTITINNNVTLTIKVADSVTGNISIKRDFGDATSKTPMFNLVGDNSKLVIQGISNSKRIILDGGNAFVLSQKSPNKDAVAKYSGSAIYITSHGDVELNYVTIQNMFVADGAGGGAAIRMTTTTKSTTSNNVVTYSNFNTNVVTLNDVVVNNCLDRSDNSILYIYGNVTMNNCSITNCAVDKNYAGVIKAGGAQNYCKLTMNNCEASGNYSSGWGGVILWACGGNGSVANLNNSVFDNNRAKYLGGAISVEGNVVLTGCTITNNEALGGGGIATFPFSLDTGDSGYNNACGLTLNDGNIIQNNHATSTEDMFIAEIGTDSTTWKTYPTGGGGIWSYLFLSGWSASLTIGEGNVVAKNTSAGKGGGIFMSKTLGENITLNIDGGSIFENKAKVGAGVYIGEGDIEFKSGAFENNISTSYGGGLCIDNGNFTMIGGLMNNNTSESSGGAIYVADGDINLESGMISNNIALDKGGAIAVTSGNVVIGIKECHDAGESSTHTHPVIEENIASDGGGIYVDGGITTMWCGDIKHNLTYEKTVNVLVISGGNFIYNGGNIGIPYDTGVFVNGGIFEDNSSDSENLKNELHYHATLSDVIYNSKIPESKWIASPRGDILHREDCDTLTPTWADLFPKYEFVGWEQGESTDKAIILNAIWQIKE